MTSRMLALGCAASLVAACGGGGSGGKPEEQQQASIPAAEQAALSTDVQLAIAVARGIDAAPAKVDSVLSAHDLTRAGLDSLMYVIAADSAKTAAYAATRP